MKKEMPTGTMATMRSASRNLKEKEGIIFFLLFLILSLCVVILARLILGLLLCIAIGLFLFFASFSLFGVDDFIPFTATRRKIIVELFEIIEGELFVGECGVGAFENVF